MYISNYTTFINESFYDDFINSINSISSFIKIKPTKESIKSYFTKLIKNFTLESNLKKILLRFFLISIFANTSQDLNLVKEFEKITNETKELTDEMKESYINLTLILYNDYIKLPISNFKSYDSFIKKKAFQESSNDPTAVNRFGYMGLFQLGEDELNHIGYSHVKVDSFKITPNIFPPEKQKQAFHNYLRLNKLYLRNYYKYIGKTISGIYITESALLGASSIGHGNVKRFLKTNGIYNPKDANGLSVRELMLMYQFYNLSNVTMMSKQEERYLSVLK